jgi:ankyrin repeat protein
MTKLHLDALAKRAKHSKKALRDALADLPLDLDKTYEDALARIATQDEEDASLAMKVLSWMLTSFRRMTVRELQEALAVQSDYDENDEEALINPEFFISVCGGLLVLDRGRYVEWISFVHLTTEEFFERNAMIYFPTAGFDISSVCVKQLTTRHIGTEELLQSPETAMNEFTEYAARYAMMHVQSSRGVGLFPAIASLWQSGQLHNVRKAFDYLTDNGASLTTLEEKSLIHPYSEFTELQLAVMYGCDDDVEAIIAKGFCEDSHPYDVPYVTSSELTRRPAVSIAIHEHKFHVLDILLEAGARLDIMMYARQDFWLTALEYAIAREDQEMVRFLLSRSPTLTSYRPLAIDGRTALHFAVRCHLPKFAAYLVGEDAGIGVDETDDDGRTALHYLARSLNYMDLGMLILSGRDSEESPRDPLLTFKVLQEASANINACDNSGNTPLDYVISLSKINRSDELRDALVKKGALIGWGKRLRAALRYGTQRDAQLLLEKNANINPLPDSSKYGMLRLLLSRRRPRVSHLEQFIRQECSLAGALLDWEGGIHSETAGESDFHWIIKKISCSVYEFMLGLTEHKIARRVHLHVLGRLLLTQKITDIDIKVGGKTPLYLATEMGSVEIVELLLSCGADDSIVGPSGLPVEVAALNCFPRVVEVLLTKKLSIRPSLVDDVHLINFSLWFQDPLTLPRDRHETVWLLCAYLGRDFPRTSETIRQRASARPLLNSPSHPATLLDSSSAIRVFLERPYKTSAGTTSWKSIEITP